MKSSPHPSNFSVLLSKWEERSRETANLQPFEANIQPEDATKIAALASIYQLSEQEIAGHLLHSALQSLEEAMPYIPGPTVIRVEEGDNIYEDVGPLPRYLKAQQHLRNNKDKGSKPPQK